MTRIVGVSEFLELNSKVEILDVRSPSEYSEGHIPQALSLPLFDDEERALVGTCYKREGPESAYLLGLDIVGPKMRTLAEKGLKLAKEGRIAVHCWRGGRRSGSIAWLLATSGLQVDLLEGGYKAYRSHIHTFFDALPFKLIVLGGRTGSRKTAVLHELARRGEQVIDLEGLASHKGSAFGWINEGAQPTTQQFENDLYDCMRSFDPSRPVWVENESKTIGKVYLYDGLWNAMKQSPLLHMEVDHQTRLDHLVSLYADKNKLEELKLSFHKITKRLGGQNVKAALEALESSDYAGAANVALHYYDKTYDYNLDNNISPDIRKVTIGSAPVDKAASLLLDHLREQPISV